MATWTVYLVANPELSSTGADLTGIADLDDASPPGNLTGATINSVRFVVDITGSGMGDDLFDRGTSALVLSNGTTDLASVTPAADTGNGNETDTSDNTDNAPSSTNGNDYDGSNLSLTTTSGASRTWAVYDQTGMPDNGTLTLDGTTGGTFIVIDYDPPTVDPAPSAIAPPAAAVPAPTVGAGTGITASAIAPPAAIVPTPTVAGHVSITATAIVGTSVVPTIAPSTGVNLAAAAITGVGTMGTATPGIGVVVVASPIIGSSTIPPVSIFELVRVNVNGDVTVTGWSAVNAGTVWQAVESDDTAYATYNY